MVEEKTASSLMHMQDPRPAALQGLLLLLRVLRDVFYSGALLFSSCAACRHRPGLGAGAAAPLRPLSFFVSLCLLIFSASESTPRYTWSHGQIR